MTTKCVCCKKILVFKENWEGEGCAECGGFLCTACVKKESTNCPDCGEMLCGKCECPECGDGE